jgi:hypothetical protein
MLDLHLARHDRVEKPRLRMRADLSLREVADLGDDQAGHEEVPVVGVKERDAGRVELATIVEYSEQRAGVADDSLHESGCPNALARR